MIILQILFAIATFISLLGLISDKDWKRYLITTVVCLAITVGLNFIG